MPNLPKDTIRLNTRISRELLLRVRFIHPELFKDPLSNSMEFSHGSLSRYFSQLVNEDLSRYEQVQKESTSGHDNRSPGSNPNPR